MGGTTYFPFSGYEEGPGSLRTKYIRIGIENIASKKSTGEKLFYHNDHLGGVNVITNDSGLLAQIIEYDPWGKVSRQEGAGDSLRRFTGKILDPESGLYYYGGRYYDPELGRFISEDPFVGDPFDPQNLNRYSYVVNNPVNGIDPDGNFHIVKKKKKKGGFFRIFSSIFLIVIGILTLQPEFTALVGIPEGANVGLGLASIAHGIAGLASGTGGLGDTGPPGLLGSPDFGLDLAAAGFLGEFFSPALRLAAETCESCPDSRLDLLRLLLGLFQPSEAWAKNDAGGGGGGGGPVGGGRGRGGSGGGRSGSGPRSLDTLPRPLPAGVTQEQFGNQIMRWGTGNEAARARIATLTRGELVKGGVTRDIAEAWREFYRQVGTEFPNNPSAQGRYELMHRAVELLGGR